MKRFLLSKNLFLAFVLVLISARAFSQTITTLPLGNNTMCSCTQLLVNYTATGVYGGANVFTVQLSNNVGNFAVPTIIGSLPTNALSGSIPCTIPCNTPFGTMYRIRVVSNVPIVTGTDNGANISIYPSPQVNITFTTANCVDTLTANVAPIGGVVIGEKYYITGAGQPWGSNSNINEMNAVFGVGGWIQGTFAINPVTVFSPTTQFVFLEGGDGNATALNTFFTTNQVLIENWVSNGGRLFLNAAPNQGGVQNWGFGGTQLNYINLIPPAANACPGVTVTNPAHPINTGPYLPVSPTNQYTANYYAHANVVNAGTTLIHSSGNPAFSVCSEKPWGSGLVVFGGMTTTNWHNNACGYVNAHAINIRQNILNYVSGTPLAPTFTYLWQPGGATTQKIIPTVTGIYTVTVTTNNGCTGTATYNYVAGPPAPVVNITPVPPILCQGSQVTLNATPGYPQYLWNNGAVTPSITVGFPLTYTVTVTNAVGCTATSTIALAQSPIINLSAVGSPAIPCNGGTTTIFALASGGVPAFQYSLNGGPFQPSNAFPNSPAGLYTITVVDANGCTKTTTLTLTQPLPINIAAVYTAIPCNGGTTTLTVGANGGQPPYQFNLNGGAYQAGNQFFNVAAGIYTIGVLDANGCTNTSTINITSPNLLVTNINTAIPPSCSPGCDGSVTVLTTGGSPGYNYTMSPLVGNINGTNGNASGLCAGIVYTITATDANGCTATTTIFFAPAVGPTLNITNLTALACFGDCNATATAVATGGVLPYTYGITAPAIINALTGNIANLCAGTYTVTVMDGSNCTNTTLLNVIQPPILGIGINQTTSPTCQPGCDGTATTITAGGTAPYSYAISGAAIINANGDASGLCAGITYTITVTDVNGCTGTTTVQLIAPNAPTITIDQTTSPTCQPGCDGTATTITAGGTAPYSYAITGAAAINAIGTASGLCAGTIYTITVTDANQCTGTTTVQLIAPNAPTITIDQTTSPTCQPGCDGTATTITAGGTAPYSYAITGAAAINANGDASGLCAGITYTITVTDANQCTGTTTVQLIAPNAPTITIDQTTSPTCQPGCDGTATTITAGGTAPFSYAISGAAIINANGDASGLCAGTIYTITVTDANQCTGTTTVQLIAPNAPTITIDQTASPTCQPGCDGTATTITAGGTAPFSYAISGAAIINANGDASGLCAGTIYTITVTDANQCTGTTTVQLIAPNAPTITIDQTASPTCQPGCDGTATTITAGGTAPFSYAISGAAIINANGDASGLCAGTIYTITVTDANQCTGTTTVQLIAPNAPTITIDQTASPTCQPGCDGTATTITAGGTAPFSYAISGAAIINANGDASGLCAGITYTITVTDVNGCTGTTTVQLIAPNAPTITIDQTTSPTCQPGCDGTATTITAGGTAPYSYAITGAAAINAIGTASGLCAGTIYTITVTDANQCTGTTTVQLIAPNAPTITIDQTTSPTCQPGCDGTATTITAGGTAPYSYAITGAAAINAIGTASGLCAGTIYTITVTDANQCTGTTTVQLIAPNAPTITIDQTTSPTCQPGCDGTATTITAGGTAPYSYAITGAAAINAIGTASGLCAGTIYTITVTDANQCTGTTTVQLIAPNAPTITIDQTTSPTCQPGCDGTATTITAGGTAPYSYAITGAAAINAIGTASGLCAGTIYTITVTDANQCTGTTTVQLIAPNAPTITIDQTTSPTCQPGCDGTATTITAGGTAPFSYAISGAAIINANGDASGLCAGTIYTITVTDANQCTGTTTVQLIAPNAPTITIDQTTSPTCQPGCDGTATTITAGGTAPYSYAISGAAIINANGDASGLCAGTIYTITVTDANQCTGTTTVQLIAPNAPTITIDQTTSPTCQPGCDGTATTITAGGTAPYSYAISGAAIINANGDASGLCAGTIYTITVTDANQCTGTTTVQLIAPNAPTITIDQTTSPTCQPGCDGTATTITAGGTAPYSYAISGAAIINANGDASGLCAGITYTITVTDANQCTGTTTVQLIAPNAPTITIDQTTSPTCQPGCDGTATTITAGGTAPFSYAISGAAIINANGDASALCSGTIYTITVTDANQCTGTTTVQLIAPNAPTITIDQTTSPTCQPGCDGTATTITAGGTAPYSYAISGAAIINANGDASALCSGTIYTITVTDANQCTGTTTVQLIAPNAPTITIDQTTSPTCQPGCDGTATTITAGGTAPFSYAISGAAIINANGDASALCSGITYTITVTDANQCTGTTTVQLIAPNAPTITIDQTTSPTCQPGCDGTATTITAGGTAPYSYAITGAAAINAIGTASGLCAGITYTITVTDANQCTGTTTVQLIAPNAPTITIDQTTSPTCQPGCDGTATTITAGGTAPYSYAITGAAAINAIGTASGLCAGTIYTITVTDANQCTGTTTVQLIAPNAPTITIDQTTSPTCQPGCDGTATTITAGGTAPFSYAISGAAIINANGDASALCSGTIYTITVTDANQCTGTTTVQLIAPNAPTITIDQTTSPTCQPGCDGTATTITAGGTAPYSYAISGAAIINANGDASALCSGTIYTITVTDANQCTGTTTVQLIAPNAPTITIDQTTSPTCQPGCDGTATTITAGGTAPFSYAISGAAIINANGDASGLCAGITYTITVTDANQCTGTTTVQLIAPNAPTITIDQTTSPTCQPGCDGTATTITAGGTAPYSYAISGAAIINANGDASALCSGTIYTITVTDANQCTGTTTVQLIAPNAPTITIDQTTSPTCQPGCDGTATTITAGGTAPFSYAISGAAIINANGDASALCSGTIYTITVTDANQCTGTTTVQLIAPNAPTITIDQTTSPTCQPGCDGTATTITAGGTAPFSYTISGAAIINANGDASGLCSGTIYTITVTDANQCTGTTTVQLIAPNAPTITIDQTTSPTCQPGCDGTATTITAGGTAPFSYAISGAAIINANGDASALCAGTIYTITVTDANQCTGTTTVQLIAPNAPTITIDQTTSPTCQPGCDGTATTITAGGTAPYSYAISGAAIINANGDASGLCAGITYTIIVTDANQCTGTTTVQLIAPNAPTITIDQTTSPTCQPGCDGTATTITAGGTAPFSYAISGAAIINANGDASALCSGITYTITVTDANQCTGTTTVQLIAPNAPTITIDQTTSPTCQPGCDGTATTITAGGTAPFSYAISGAAIINANGDASALCSGTIYTITVTDANQCTGTTTVQLIAPNAPTITIDQTTSPTCQPGCDGTATTITAGGTAPYSYAISGAAIINANGDASALCAGTIYTITVTDANQCTGTTTVQLIAPNAPTITIDQTTSPTCQPGCDGTATTITAGGTAPYSYAISGAAIINANGDASALCSGTIYTITVTDANQCTGTTTVQLIAPNAPTITIDQTTSPTCQPGCDGTATTITAGGTAPFSYAISGAAIINANGDASALCSGTIYTITVTDANQCTGTTTVQLIAPNAPTITIDQTTSPTCQPGCDGTATTITAGGTAPFSYAISGAAIINANGDASGLCAGITYTITVTDANQCTGTTTVQLIAPNAPTITIDQTTSPTCQPGCDGTATTITAGGTAPFSYAISGAAIINANGDASALCSGTIYTITVTDANQCTGTTTVQLIAPNAPTITIDQTTSPTCQPGCDGTATTITAGGTAPFSYAISGAAIINANGDASGLCAGITYTITVTDANQCTGTTTVQLIAPNAPTITIDQTTSPTCQPGCDGTATTITAGGTAPYSYAISGAAIINANGDASALCSGTIYTITVTDANQCTGTTTVQLIAPNAPTITIDQTTSPTCQPGCDGTATTITAGGTAPFSYAISGAAIINANGDASGLCAGTTYTITVTDANQCTGTTTVQLIAPNAPTITIDQTTSPTCQPGCDGTATTITAGGTAPFSYAISGAAIINANGDASALCSGTIYTITVTDANQCTGTTTVQLIAPNAPTIVISNILNVTCNGLCDATAQATANGGLLPYQYSIQPFGTIDINTGAMINLCAGIYTVSAIDGNGCIGTASFTITEPTILTAAVIAFTNITIPGGNDGTITAQGNGGTAPYVYTITPLGPQGPGAFFTNLTAQCYTITVTDANGCTATTTQCLIEPPANVTISATHTDVSCYGSCDGTITGTASGGVLPYVYTLNPGGVPSGTGLYAGLCAGTYTLLVTAQNNMQDSIVITIGSPSQIVFNAPVVVNPICNPGNSGSISITANGGTGAITYMISPLGPQGPTGNFTALTPGTYTITATDAIGCNVTTTVQLLSPTAPVLNVVNINNVSCTGNCNGSAQINAVGGLAPYGYVISAPGNINATGFASALCAGTYTVTATDANLCTSTVSFTITEPTVLQYVTASGTDPLCAGDANGTIIVDVTGGTGGYAYGLNPANGLQAPVGTFTGLVAWVYTVTAMDANGCTVTTQITLNDPASIVWTNTTANNISCNGSGDGSISVTAGGGVGNYVYTITPLGPQPNQTGIYQNLSAQCYTVTATDANGCSITTVLCITEPPVLSLGVPVTTNALCFGDQSGSITIGAIGGNPIPNYTYVLQPGGQSNTTGVFGNVGAGTYAVTVTDGSGCTAIATGIVINQPMPVVYNTVNINNIYCYGEATGSVAVVASGGTGNILFSINPAATQFPLGFFKDLYAGSYVITATDANGCTATTQVTVTQNPALTFTSISTVEPICSYDSTGIIFVTATGGTSPILYSLNNGTPRLNGTFTGLTIAQYKVTLIDDLGCSKDTMIYLGGPSPVGADITLEDAKCVDSKDGRLIANGTGGRGGYKYYVTPGLRINKTGRFYDLAPGTYTLRVVDTVGCEYQTEFTINPPQNPLSNTMTKVNLICLGKGNEGSATANAYGGQPPYVYEWSTSPVQNTPTASNLYYGWYNVLITDAYGCTIHDTVYVEEGPCCEVSFIPNAFSPNGDNTNDEFRVLTTAGTELIQFEVYDRWGQRLWSSSDYRRGWDGTIDGKEAGVGTYFYIYKYRCTRDGEIYVKKGDVTLIR